MDTIEKLIKALEEAKESLNKGMNCGSSHPEQVNMGKGDIVKPDTGFGKLTIKDATPTPPKDPSKPYGKVIMKEELECSANGQWNLLEKDAANPKLAPKEVKIKQLQAQIDAGTYKPDSKKIAGAMLKEEECHEDPNHEAKEKEKASKIKEQAEEILDLHKD